MRAVVCVLALAFAAFAVASVRAAAADVEMVEAELVDADHPALMEVVRARGGPIGGVAKKAKGAIGKGAKAAANKLKGAAKGAAKGAGKGKEKKTKPKPKPKAPKFNGNTGIAGGLPGASKVPGQPEPKFNGNTGIAGGLPGASKVPGQPGRKFGTGAKGGQAADKWDPYGKRKGGKGGKGKKKVVKGDFPTPGKEAKTIGGHGTGAFGGQKADGWDASQYEPKAVNRDATKGGPIGGAFSKLFGHKMGEKPAGNTGIVPPGLAGLAGGAGHAAGAGLLGGAGDH